MADVPLLDDSHRLWRDHGDAVNAAWLEARLAGIPPGRLLKTDAYDEAHTRGLCGDLRRLGWRVLAVDAALPVLFAARRRADGAALAAADVRSLPLPDGGLDLVVSLSTLDHFEEAGSIGESLRELHRVLRPGGRLLLTLDNPANPAVGLRNALPLRWLRRLGLVPYPVGRTLSPDALVDALGAVGFAVRDRRALLHCPRAPAVAACRWLQTRGRPAWRGRFLGWLLAFERLGRLRTRYRTGHFTAVDAVKEKAAGVPR